MNFHFEKSHFYVDSSNISIDPFLSTQSEHRGRVGWQPQHIPHQSIELFNGTSKRRSSNGLAGVIRNALDPDYDSQQNSMDVFSPSTSTFVNYNDDASILAAVSSAHSSQEHRFSQSPVKKSHRKQVQSNNYNDETKTNYSSIFNRPIEEKTDLNMQDFLSPEQIQRCRKSQKPRVKQIRMDDYVFKARRVDKGAREFGLHTTHEPKRGSKKKRDSIEQLEVEKAVLEEQKKRKRVEVLEQKKTEVENVDFSLAFGTPSPVRSKSKTSNLTQFFKKNTSKSRVPSELEIDLHSKQKQEQRNLKSSISFNNPNTYLNDSILEATVCSTPDKAILMETVPLGTSSPAGKQTTPKRKLILGNSSRRLDLIKPNPMKRKESGFEVAQHKEQPVAQLKRPKLISYNKKPEFDYPSSPITLNDDDDYKAKNKPIKRPTLQSAEERRKKFGVHVLEREQMMRSLVDQEFKEERENGGIDRRKAELKDGQVIRNKEMRKNLMHGASCKCCRGYYDGLDMEEGEKKDYINKISRHRYVHQPLPDTPERYWDLTLGPQEEQRMMTEQRSWETSIKNKKKEEQTGINNWN